jgi:pyrroloquinoline quinone (PQQ) biosynthesis protein C
MALIIRHDVSARGEDGLTVLENDDVRLELEGAPLQATRRLLSHLDGSRALDDFTMLPAGDARAIADALVDAGLAREAGDPHQIVDIDRFTALARELYPQWKARLFGRGLWKALVEGTASFTQFAGWLLENYHFIEGVNDRLGSATAYAQNRAARRHFAQHYREEYDHGGFFLEALQQLGIHRQDVDASLPLPTTRAILHHMRRCARNDSLQYAACSAFLESTGGDRSNARAFFDAIAKHYAPTRPQIVAPLVAHLDLDEDYGHNGVLERVAPMLAPITAARASAALEAARALVELLQLWSADIAAHYTDADALPRAKSYGRYRRPLPVTADFEGVI